jgi:hypothetical protein
MDRCDGGTRFCFGFGFGFGFCFGFGFGFGFCIVCPILASLTCQVHSTHGLLTTVAYQLGSKEGNEPAVYALEGDWDATIAVCILYWFWFFQTMDSVSLMIILFLSFRVFLLLAFVCRFIFHPISPLGSISVCGLAYQWIQNNLKAVDNVNEIGKLCLQSFFFKKKLFY